MNCSLLVKEKGHFIMEKIKLERINELAKKSKIEPLTAEELEEQKALRQEYIAEIRLSFGAMLDNTVVQSVDGKKTPLKEYNENVKNTKK